MGGRREEMRRGSERQQNGLIDLLGRLLRFRNNGSSSADQNHNTWRSGWRKQESHDRIWIKIKRTFGPLLSIYRRKKNSQRIGFYFVWGQVDDKIDQITDESKHYFCFLFLVKGLMDSIQSWWNFGAYNVEVYGWTVQYLYLCEKSFGSNDVLSLLEYGHFIASIWHHPNFKSSFR